MCKAHESRKLQSGTPEKLIYVSGSEMKFNLKLWEEGFPGAPVVKNPPCNARDPGSIPDLGRSHTLTEQLSPWTINYRASALETTSSNYWAHVLHLLKSAHLESLLHSKKSHCNEMPVQVNDKSALLAANRESPCAVMKTHHSQYINKSFKK